jgi:hypothetical protein
MMRAMWSAAIVAGCLGANVALPAVAAAQSVAPKASVWEAFAARSKHPLANVQVGDYADFTGKLPELGLGGGAPSEVSMRMTVKERTEKSVTLTRQAWSGGREAAFGNGEITYDLTKPWDPSKAANLQDAKEGAEAKIVSRKDEMIRTKDLVMPAERVQYEIKGESAELPLKVEVVAWISPEGPLTGLVAMEQNVLGFKITLLLSDWGPVHSETLREIKAVRLTKNEGSRLTFETGGKPLGLTAPGQSFALFDKAGQRITGYDTARYLASGNVFHVKTVLRANAESLAELRLEEGGPTSVATLVAALPRKIGSYDPKQPRFSPALWERTLARAKVGDWVVYREGDKGRIKYREVTEVKPPEVICWEVYNLERSYSNGVKLVLDEPVKAKATATKKKATPKKTTSKKPSKTTPKTAKIKRRTDEEGGLHERELTVDETPEPRVTGTETVSVMGRELSCDVVEIPRKSGRGIEAKLWISTEVPLDGVVKREEKGKVVYLLEEFGKAE